MKITSSRKGKKSETSVDELRLQILRVARKHFAQYAFQGASLKEIAQEADVASSLINYHFKDKAGLFKACVELFASERHQAINRILSEPKSVEEMRVRLEVFVEEMVASILADPYGFQIIEHEIKIGNPMVIEVFQDSLLKGFKTVVGFFRQAQENGLIRGDLDSVILASLLFSATCDSTRKDHMGKAFFNVSLEQADYRKKFVRHIIMLFMNGVTK